MPKTKSVKSMLATKEMDKAHAILDLDKTLWLTDNVSMQSVFGRKPDLVDEEGLATWLRPYMVTFLRALQCKCASINIYTAGHHLHAIPRITRFFVQELNIAPGIIFTRSEVDWSKTQHGEIIVRKHIERMVFSEKGQAMGMRMDNVFMIDDTPDVLTNNRDNALIIEGFHDPDLPDKALLDMIVYLDSVNFFVGRNVQEEILTNISLYSHPLLHHNMNSSIFEEILEFDEDILEDTRLVPYVVV